MGLLKKSTASTEAGSTHQLSTLQLLHSATSALFAQASLHTQLAQVEWQIEKQRLFTMLVFALLGFACFLCVLLFGGVLAIALSWDSLYRVHIIILVESIFSLATLMAALKLRKIAALGCDSFSATRREIAADIALFKEML